MRRCSCLGSSFRARIPWRANSALGMRGFLAEVAEIADRSDDAAARSAWWPHPDETRVGGMLAIVTLFAKARRAGPVVAVPGVSGLARMNVVSTSVRARLVLGCCGTPREERQVRRRRFDPP